MSLLQNILPTFTRGQTCSTEGADSRAGESVATKPQFSVQENADGYNLVVYVPGVAKDGVEITTENEQFRVVARRSFQPPAGWRPVYGEIETGNYELVLACGDDVDAGRATAELTDGVLRIALPKSEAVKPRKIAVA